jgi:hypothetical protein
VKKDKKEYNYIKMIGVTKKKIFVGLKTHRLSPVAHCIAKQVLMY